MTSHFLKWEDSRGSQRDNIRTAHPYYTCATILAVSFPVSASYLPSDKLSKILQRSGFLTKTKWQDATSDGLELRPIIYASRTACTHKPPSSGGISCQCDNCDRRQHACWLYTLVRPCVQEEKFREPLDRCRRIHFAALTMRLSWTRGILWRYSIKLTVITEGSPYLPKQANPRMGRPR